MLLQTHLKSLYAYNQLTSGVPRSGLKADITNHFFKIYYLFLVTYFLDPLGKAENYNNKQFIPHADSTVNRIERNHDHCIVKSKRNRKVHVIEREREKSDQFIEDGENGDETDDEQKQGNE